MLARNKKPRSDAPGLMASADSAIAASRRVGQSQAANVGEGTDAEIYHHVDHLNDYRIAVWKSPENSPFAECLAECCPARFHCTNVPLLSLLTHRSDPIAIRHDLASTSASRIRRRIERAVDVHPGQLG
jgi:hypothetical protein